METIKIKLRLLFFLLAATITLTVLSGCFDMGKLTAATQDLPSLGAPSSSSAVKLFISATNSSNSLNTCLPLSLSAVNFSDDPANVASTTTVSLSGAGLGVFYSNSNCTTTTSAVNIEAGTSSTNFYFKTTSSGSYLFMATANNLTSGTYTLTLSSGSLTNPQTLALKINGSTSINNDCSPYMLLNVDSLGFAANVSGNLTLTLGGGGAGQFYSDNACTTTITTATISAGLSFIVVYYKNLTVQSILMTVDAPTYATAFLPVNVSSGTMSNGGTSTFGPAAKLSYLVQPSLVAIVGENFLQQPILVVVDTNNNIVTTATNNITLSAYSDIFCSIPAAGTLNAATNPMNATNGVATFSSVNETQGQIIYLKASATGLSSACSSAVIVSAAVPSKLAFSTQPSTTATAGTLYSVQPVVQFQTATGGLVTSAAGYVTLSAFTDSACSVAASGIFSVATNPELAVSGVVTFSGVKHTYAGSIYLKATSSLSGVTSACSTLTTVSAAVPGQLTYLTQPSSSGSTGGNLAIQPRVLIHDAYGNLTNSTDTIALSAHATSNCSGAPLLGFSNNSTPAISGAAVFSGVNTTATGTLFIKASDSTSGGVVAACSQAVTISGGAATQIEFSTQPSTSANIYIYFAQQPTVVVKDSYGNVATNSTAAVTLAAYSDATCDTPAPGTLGVGSNPVTVSGGFANFTQVYESLPQTLYLKATSAGLSSACSSAVVVSAGNSLIATGDAHTCTVTDGYVYCWGRNNYGQLGDGTLNNSPIPVQVLGAGGSAAPLSGIISITAGGYHTCALNSAGAVYCWGLNGLGQIGDNTSINRKTPVQVLGVGGVGTLSNIKSMSAGLYFTCAVHNSGSVYCWGHNSNGQIGDDTQVNSMTPLQVHGVGNIGTLSNIDSLSAGAYHACGKSSTGEVFCWGSNDYGQIGDNTVSINRKTPVQVVGVSGIGNLSSITGVEVGAIHSCALSSSGSVYCWGNNGQGQLGNNSTSSTQSTPVQVLDVGGSGNLSNIVSVDSGGYHTCAINSSEAAFCWGANSVGLLGDNTTTQRLTPVQVHGVSDVGYLSNLTAISGGTSHTCALSNSGGVFCWGYNEYSQLGNGNKINQWTPIKTWSPGIGAGQSMVATGANYTCSLRNGSVYCWGYNANGELGDATNSTRTSPVPVRGVGGNGFLSNIISLAAGNSHTCALSNLGTVFCWGSGWSGSLGHGSSTAINTPVQVLGVGGSGALTNIVAIAAGQYHTCALSSAGAVYCWGYNAYGQIGDNTSGAGTDRFSPVQVAGVAGAGTLASIISITAGGNHTCALSSAGAVYCWGYNGQGQIGDASSTQRSAPVQVVGVGGSGFLANITSIKAGSSHSCALSSLGTVYCWGSNGSYQLGDNTSLTRTSPVQVVGVGGSGNLSNVSSITLGNSHTCAINNSNVLCWGNGGQGELGKGSWTNGPVPTVVLGLGGNSDSSLSKMLSVTSSPSSQFTCALTLEGNLYCWGYNGSYQLGEGTVNNATYPIPSQSPIAPSQYLQNITSIAAGYGHSCAVSNGYSYCWGNNANGDLGNGNSIASYTPVISTLASSTTLSGVTSSGTGQAHSCALTSAGTVYCWGDNVYGDLGILTTTETHNPTQVAGFSGNTYLTSVTALSVGYHHNCAITGGSVYCWGYNAFGQLGNNSTISTAAPTPTTGIGGVGTLTNITQVAAGYKHSCALSSTGNVYCWGNNELGQLGANLLVSQSNTPVGVVSTSGSGLLSGVTAIAAGGNHTCAIASGQVFCWGANTSGQLGDNSTTNSTFPVGTLNSGLVGLMGMSSITTGNLHSCASSNSATYCWGDNTYGQLGTGNFTTQWVATSVNGVGGSGALSGISQISAGATGFHTCGRSSSGATYCWGNNSSGQLGIGSVTLSNNPAQTMLATDPFFSLW